MVKYSTSPCRWGRTTRRYWATPPGFVRSGVVTRTRIGIALLPPIFVPRFRSGLPRFDGAQYLLLAISVRRAREEPKIAAAAARTRLVALSVRWTIAWKAGRGSSQLHL